MAGGGINVADITLLKNFFGENGIIISFEVFCFLHRIKWILN
jgi:hypothetical protein